MSVERGAEDGPISVERIDDTYIHIRVEHGGMPYSIRCTEWNARRILAGLSLLLDLPLQPKAAKQIEM